MSGQTESQVGKFQTYKDDLWSTCADMRWLPHDGKPLCRLDKFVLDQSPRKVHASQRKWGGQTKLRRLTSPFNLASWALLPRKHLWSLQSRRSVYSQTAWHRHITTFSRRFFSSFIHSFIHSSVRSFSFFLSFFLSFSSFFSLYSMCFLSQNCLPFLSRSKSNTTKDNEDLSTHVWKQNKVLSKFCWNGNYCQRDKRTRDMLPASFFWTWRLFWGRYYGVWQRY